jgi:exopolysaccharide production protein ExoQ
MTSPGTALPGTFSRQGGAVAAALIMTPFAAVGGGVAMALIAAIMALVAFDWRTVRAAALRTIIPLAILYVFIGWVAWTSTWSPTPELHQERRLIAMAAIFPLLVAAAGTHREADRALIQRASVSAVAALSLFLLIEALGLHVTGSPIFNRMAQPDTPLEPLLRNPGKGGTILSILVWAGLGAALASGRPWGSIFARVGLLLAAVCATQFGMAANLLAFAAGLIAFLLAWALPRFTLVAGGVTIAGWIMAAPFVAQRVLGDGTLNIETNSWRMRLDIWRFASERILEKPLTGWGLDGARGFKGQTYDFDVNGKTYAVEHIPLHTHNQPLQVWLETGAIGAGLAALGILAVAIFCAMRLGHDRRAAAAAAGVLAAITVHANVSFGVWQEWWWGVIAVAAAAVAAIAAPRPIDVSTRS